jgi:hypothetical protein
MRSFLGSGMVTDCMNEKVGFTEGCTRVWVENVMCDLKKCIFTCLKMKLGLSGNGNNDRAGKLNACLECDEKRCGPAFIEEAGANRRRSGIVSDIGRDDESEVCDIVDDGWIGWGEG